MLEFIMRYDSTALPTRMETVVRCKNCKHAEDLTKLHDSWFCKRNCCAKPPIEPDGFCAWGEEREV